MCGLDHTVHIAVFLYSRMLLDRHVTLRKYPFGGFRGGAVCKLVVAVHHFLDPRLDDELSVFVGWIHGCVERAPRQVHLPAAGEGIQGRAAGLRS